MCGIIGYVGKKDILSVLIVGLERLSYRGYDSAGVAVVADDEISSWKRTGKVHVLAKELETKNSTAMLGIGHTRWATHGVPNEVNAHPHLNARRQFSIVHNGIIENYMQLKSELVQEGYLFRSQTDSEVIVHLIEKNYDGCLVKAVQKTAEKLVGSFAFCAVSAHDSEAMVVARKNSPLVIGVGTKENYVSSDVNALVPHTKKVIYLEDSTIARVCRKNINVYDFSGEPSSYQVSDVHWTSEQSEKSGYDYFMQKEIHEQPQVVRTILDTYLHGNDIVFPNLKFKENDLKDMSRFIIQACGTSWHAGLIGKYLIEDLGRVPTEVDISSEFRYRRLLSSSNEIVVAISQSGETADTLACIREAKSKFFSILSFVNVAGSSIDRESDGVIYTQSGPEIGVASTKNYLGQILTIYLFSLYLGRIRGTLSEPDYLTHIKNIKMLPVLIEKTLSQEDAIKAMMSRYFDAKSFIFIGRGLNYPTALEGALKLKELSYIHATGYPAGELKHGPIALIDDELPVVCVVPKTATYEKMMSNIQEVKARGGRLIMIGTEGDDALSDGSDDVIYIPAASDELTPLLTVIPLQIMSYYIAVQLGCDVDQPRNLAKSVTVE
ncbi:MAG: glutamine--fructose-6-phosphate transaminase (isomerizing) [Candidatus Marinamargulisbacteria bacterium]